MTTVTGPPPSVATTPAPQPPVLNPQQPPAPPQPVTPPPLAADDLQKQLVAAKADLVACKKDLKDLSLQVGDTNDLRDSRDHARSVGGIYRLIAIFGVGVLLIGLVVMSLNNRRIRIIVGIVVAFLTALVFFVAPAAAATLSKLEPYKIESGKTADVTITGVGFGNDLAKISAAFSSDPAHGQPNLGVVKKSVAANSFVLTVTVPAGAPDSFRELWLDDGSGMKKTALSLAVVSSAVSSALDVADTRYLQAGREVDPVFRSFLLGMTQYYGVDYGKVVSLLQSPKTGTSKEALGMIETARQVATVNATLGDARLKEIVNAGVSGGITAYFQSNPLPTPATPVDLKPVIDQVTAVNNRVTGVVNEVNTLSVGYQKQGAAITALDAQHKATRTLAIVTAQGTIPKMSSKGGRGSLQCQAYLALAAVATVPNPPKDCVDKPAKPAAEKKK